jgi:dihydroorotate dehydrogenase (fumarate)
MSMDLSTTYLGLRLPHPFMAGASPLAATVDGARKLEEAGSAAIVLPSLFEEGMIGGEIALRSFYGGFADSPSMPAAAALGLSPRNYLAHLARVKEAVRTPVIASLNGTAPGAWTKSASLLENEGADALELNLYTFTTETWESSETVERRLLELVRSIKASIRIPLAVKLSPFCTSLPNFVRELDHAGAGAVLLFNRFTPADIDLERLELVRTMELSTSSELPLRLRWLAVLHGKISASLGITGGVHTAEDAVKAVLTGAHGIQVVSELLEHGVGQLDVIRRGVEDWLRERRIPALDDLRGRMSLLRAPDPKAVERMNYIYNLDSWYGPTPAPARRRSGTRRSASAP